MIRRSFLKACIASFTAPAIVRASSLMPVRAPKPSPLAHPTGQREFAPRDYIQAGIYGGGGHQHPDCYHVVTYNTLTGLWEFHR